MINIFYSIIVYPLSLIIELCYLFVFRVFKNHAISLFGVSAAVSLLTLPLYFRAEKWQDIERSVQKQFQHKISKIKSVFSGDERYMVLSAFYRQNNYHPVYSLRSSLDILIQIPFFIAAYTFIGHLEVLHGISFLFIKDLSKPDMLLNINGIIINFLPVLMTLINCTSAAVYTHGFPLKDKVQVYGISIVFLVLLYNSPSALVLYWTANNIFSLVKNILQKTSYSKKIIYFTLCTGILLFDIFILFFHPGYFLKRIIVFLAVSLLLFIPIFKRLGVFLIMKIRKPGLNYSAVYQNITFFAAIFSLFLLTGFVIPSMLISTSVSEFSFLENYTSPFPFIGITVVQAAGLFLFWPLGIYFLFSKKIRVSFTLIAVFFCMFSFINVFLFPGNNGFLTNTLLFSNPGTWMANIPFVMLNIAVLLFFIPPLLFLLTSPRLKKLFISLQIIIAFSLLGAGTVSAVQVKNDFNEFSQRYNGEIIDTDFTPVYKLSKTGKNVVIIMLDRATSGFLPYMFAEKPELETMWSGFTWYPNCVSFSGWTLYGIPSLAGGYEYTPLRMQENPKPLVEKHNEALLLLPCLFAGQKYDVYITDPPWSNYAWTPDLSLFEAYPDINASNISSSYSAYADTWLRSHPDIKILSVPDLLKERLIRFSLFKAFPAILRIFIYDRGDWLTINDRDLKEGRKELTLNMIGKYAALDYLPLITSINSNSAGGLAMIYNELTHDPAFLEAPEYIPVSYVSNRGNGPFADEAHYHVNMAAFLLLGRWFSWLKENNVYDNTRIIVVSDHGWNINTGNNTFKLPDGNRIEKFISLLLVKDFNSGENFLINETFMTQADVPLLALEDIIANPVNPFSGSMLKSEKQDGVTITNSNKFYPVNHGKYHFNISNNEWIHVHDNIFKPENWIPLSKIP